MKIDINKLAEHFARTPFRVELVHRYGRNPGGSSKDFSEPFPGFVFPFVGQAEFTFNGTPYLLQRGKVVHGGARMEFSRKVIGDVRWEYLLVLYQICGDEPEDFSLQSTHFELVTGQSAYLQELLQRLWKISSQPGGIRAFQTESLFRNVLEEVFVCARAHMSNGAQSLFEQAVEYIHEHYMNELTIPMLAARSGVNRNQIAYAFNKNVGMGPGEYLLRYRLNRSKELLLECEATVRDIAQLAGFSDPYYFSRAFKKQFGMSPVAFRRIHK